MIWKKLEICPNQGVGEKIRPVETKSQLFLKHFGGGLPLVRCPTIIDIISIQIRDEYIIARCYIVLFWIWCAHLTSRLTDGKSGALQVLMRWREKKPVLTGRARGRLAHLAAYSPRRVKTINCAGKTSGMHWAELDVNCNYGKSTAFRMFLCEFVCHTAFNSIFFSNYVWPAASTWSLTTWPRTWPSASISLRPERLRLRNAAPAP